MIRSIRSTVSKTIALQLLLCLTATIVHSQDRGFIGLGLGPSFALGDFASVDGNNDNAGFAAGGLLVDLSFGYKLGERFGVAGLIRSQANTLDADALARAAVAPGYMLTVQTGSYGLGGFFLGGYGSFEINEKLSFETRALIGYAVTQAPSSDFRYSNLSNGQTILLKQGTASAGAFAYNVGIGIRRNLGKRFGLSTMLDFIGTNPEFEYQVTDFDGSTSYTVVSQPVSALNVTVNFAYRFGVNQ